MHEYWLFNRFILDMPIEHPERGLILSFIKDLLDFLSLPFSIIMVSKELSASTNSLCECN